MKTIIAGSRTINDSKIVVDAIKESGFNISAVLCGCAPGVDNIGKWWAIKNSIPIEKYWANWKQGKQAGILRNIRMGDNADALIAIWDGESKGTKHMIDYAKKIGLKVFVKICNITTASSRPAGAGG